METQVCIKCEIEYPLQDRFFALAHGSSVRRVTVCRECRKEYDRQYRLNKKEDEVGGGMYTIKEEPIESKKYRLAKAVYWMHLQAFGEQLTENIYYCKNDECVQITDDVCGSCNNKMENIGFIDYNEVKK
jgi:hypothetical protein